jgi:hypothetical protein
MHAPPARRASKAHAHLMTQPPAAGPPPRRRSGTRAPRVRGASVGCRAVCACRAVALARRSAGSASPLHTVLPFSPSPPPLPLIFLRVSLIHASPHSAEPCRHRRRAPSRSLPCLHPPPRLARRGAQRQHRLWRRALRPSRAQALLLLRRRRGSNSRAALAIGMCLAAQQAHGRVRGKRRSRRAQRCGSRQPAPRRAAQSLRCPLASLCPPQPLRALLRHHARLLRHRPHQRHRHSARTERPHQPRRSCCAPTSLPRPRRSPRLQLLQLPLCLIRSPTAHSLTRLVRHPSRGRHYRRLRPCTRSDLLKMESGYSVVE